MPYDFAYDYGFNGAEAAAAGVAGFLSVFLILYYLFMIGICIAVYVMYSSSLYTIAQRRGIHHPWLAWIPVGSAWLLGSISDQYQAIAKKQVRNHRKVLLGLNFGLIGTCFIMLFGVLAAVLSDTTVADPTEVLFGAGLAVVLLALFAYMILALITAVFQYIALYNLFSSCDPNNAVLYLVLSILFTISLPILLLICRKKDLGMPPRKRPTPIIDTSAPVEAPVEEAPMEEAPVEEAPVEEAPMEEAPVEEAPVEEAPVEEASVEEAPAEEIQPE